MLSIERKANIVHLMTEIVLRPELKGDWVETGTWMGGASLIAAYVQKFALEEPSCGPGVSLRKIWLADSFEDLPPEADDETKEAGYTKTMDKAGSYAFEGGLDKVKNLFLKHGFEIDGSGNVPIYFIKGYFNDTLHDSPIEDIAVLRLDGDMYASTLQALFALYRRVSMDGYVIVSILWLVVFMCYIVMSKLYLISARCFSFEHWLSLHMEFLGLCPVSKTTYPPIPCLSIFLRSWDNK